MGSAACIAFATAFASLPCAAYSMCRSQCCRNEYPSAGRPARLQYEYSITQGGSVSAAQGSYHNPGCNAGLAVRASFEPKFNKEWTTQLYLVTVQRHALKHRHGAPGLRRHPGQSSRLRVSDGCRRLI